MTFFQMLIEFSKLNDLEKKYLSEAYPDRSFVIKRYDRSVNHTALTEVEVGLVEKGWLHFYDEEHYFSYDKNQLAISPTHREFFMKIQHWTD